MNKKNNKCITRYLFISAVPRHAGVWMLKGITPDVLNLNTRHSQWSWPCRGRFARDGRRPAIISVVDEVAFRDGLSTVVQRKFLPLAEF
jgi:hypothetical protein